MPLLSTADLAQIKSDINEIVVDTSINTTIKYRQYAGHGYLRIKDQVIPYIYTDWSGVSAIKGLATKTEVETTSGIEIGDLKYVFMQSSVSNTLSVSDIVVESSTTYQVKKISKDPLSLIYQVYCNTG